MRSIIKVIYFSLISTFVFTQCASTRDVLPSQHSGKMIEFGSGGGFSGAVSSYTLLDNGTLFQNEAFQDTSTLIKKLDKNLTLQIFTNYQVLSLSDMIINDPGNLYKFVTFIDGDSKHKLVWSGKSDEKNLNLFYNILNSLKID